MKANALLFCLCMSVISLCAQNTTKEKLESFVKNINTFNRLNPQEKVYLHFDNTGYYVGETIWFKAYVVSSENNNYTSLSKVLYVELLSPKGDIITTHKVRLDNGQGYGDIRLEDHLKTGYYEIRAYTRYMLNFEKDIAFSRVFPIYKEKKEKVEHKIFPIETSRDDRLTLREKQPKSKNVNLEFYPEGGNIVAGLRSRIAFKATNKNGESIDVEGAVYNQSNQVVANFNTLHKGMGIFDIIPEIGKYKVKALYNGKEHSFNLPEVLPSGYVLNVNNQDSTYLFINLQKSPEYIADSIGVSVSCRGKIYAFETIYWDQDSYFLRLAKGNMPTGTLQITVFDAQGKIYAERLTFNNSQGYLPLNVVQKEREYLPFEKITLDFLLKHKNDNPIETSFSLSVRDSDTEVPTFYENNILTDLLLSSELRGYIDNPSYYFEKDDKYRRQKLDLLMMVQGWRRYDWQQMAGLTPFEPVHPIEKGILVEGTILSVFGKKKRENIEVTKLITNKDSGFSVGSCLTDSVGNFNFLLDIDGVWQMTLQTKEKNKKKDYRVLLNRNFSPEPKTYSYYETLFRKRQKYNIKGDEQLTDTVIAPLTDEEKEELSKVSDNVKAHWLEEVVVKKKVDRLEDEGYEYASMIYDVEEEVDKIRDEGGYEEQDIYEFLMDLNPYFAWRTLRCGRKFYYKSHRVIFIVDNMRSSAKNIFVNRIKSLAIVENDLGTHKYLTESQLASMKKFVAVYIYTDRTKGKRRENKGIRPTKLVGYSVPTDFYNPDYTVGIPADEKDLRRTLYWNPNVKTDSNGKASVSFYNNSTCRKINISAEGLTTEGIPFVNQ